MRRWAIISWRGKMHPFSSLCKYAYFTPITMPFVCKSFTSLSLSFLFGRSSSSSLAPPPSSSLSADPSERESRALSLRQSAKAAQTETTYSWEERKATEGNLSLSLSYDTQGKIYWKRNGEGGEDPIVFISPPIGGEDRRSSRAPPGRISMFFVWESSRLKKKGRHRA